MIWIFDSVFEIENIFGPQQETFVRLRRIQT